MGASDAMPHETVDGAQRPKSRWIRGTLAALAILLFLANVGLALWAAWSTYFVSVAPYQYVALVWGIFSGIVAIVPVAAIAYRIAHTIITGEKVAKKRVSIDRLVDGIVNGVSIALRRPTFSVPIIVLLVATAPIIYLFTQAKTSPRTSSSVVAVTQGDDTWIYVADPDNGRVLVFQSKALSSRFNEIPIGTHGNQPGHGRPEQMIELRRDKIHFIFVTDTASDKIHIIDLKYNSVSNTTLPVGPAPRALAITPDRKKLFVSNEQPIPNGTISVFDIGGDKPEEFRLIAKITQVNCPEGLALSPNGRRLYAATQCGGGGDAVVAIDTATNNPLYAILKLAVGSTVTVSRDGSELYVGRGNAACHRSKSNEQGSPFSVVSLSDKAISTFCLRTSVGPMALSRDRNQHYLFVANGNNVTVFETDKLADPKKIKEMLNEPDPSFIDIAVGSPVAGIGVADDNSVYAYLPQSKTLWMYSPPMISR